MADPKKRTPKPRSPRKADAVIAIQPVPASNSSSDTIVTTAEASAEDLPEKVAKLSEKLDKALEKQHNEQRNIIIGVLLAAVFIVVAVAVEVVIFNADFNDSLVTTQQQEHQDYKSLRDSADKNQDSMEQQLFSLKLNQQTAP